MLPTSLPSTNTRAPVTTFSIRRTISPFHCSGMSILRRSQKRSAFVFQRGVFFCSTIPGFELLLNVNPGTSILPHSSAGGNASPKVATGAHSHTPFSTICDLFAVIFSTGEADGVSSSLESAEYATAVAATSISRIFTSFIIYFTFLGRRMGGYIYHTVDADKLTPRTFL